MNGLIAYEGKSRIDGAPIVVILTALNGSMNTKTGHMVQSYILRADIDPVKAAKTGLDASICGDCQHRPTNARLKELGGSLRFYPGLPQMFEEFNKGLLNAQHEAHGIRVEPEIDAMFKRALAAFTLHCASRPRNELTAWTINFQSPRLNVFLVGDNGTGAITGRVFTENVRELPENVFYSDVVRGAEPKRRSAVNFTGTDPLAAAERFYAQSEQRLARLFELPDEDFVMLVEHPDCDRAWLESLDAAAVAKLDQTEELTLLERRMQSRNLGVVLAAQRFESRFPLLVSVLAGRRRRGVLWCGCRR